MGMPLSLYGLLEDGRTAAIDPHKEGKRDTLLPIDRKTGKSTPLEGFGANAGQRCVAHRQSAALHGIEDSVVSVEQSRSMNRKLLLAKRNVRYVELGGDDHWLSSASTRTQMLEELEALLAQSLKK